MTNSSETDALRQANDAFYAAFSSLDIERMSDVWAHDPEVKCVHPGWMLLEEGEPTSDPIRVMKYYRKLWEYMTK